MLRSRCVKLPLSTVRRAWFQRTWNIRKLICCNALCMIMRQVVCKSCSCCWNLPCKSAISVQELKWCLTINIKCQACLRAGGHFSHVLWHALSSVIYMCIYEEMPWVWVWFSVELPALGIFFSFFLWLQILYICVVQMHISWSKVTEHVCVFFVCMLMHTHTCAYVDQKVKNPPYFQLQDVSLIVTIIDWESFLRLAWISIVLLLWILIYSYTRH